MLRRPFSQFIALALILTLFVSSMTSVAAAQDSRSGNQKATAPARTSAPTNRSTSASIAGTKFGLGSLGSLVKKPSVIGSTTGTYTSGVVGGAGGTMGGLTNLATSQMPNQIGGLSNSLMSQMQNSNWGGELIKDANNEIPGWVFGAAAMAINWKTIYMGIMRLPPYLAAMAGNWGTWANVANVALTRPTANPAGNPLYRTHVNAQFMRYQGGKDAAQDYGSGTLPRSVAGPGAFMNLADANTGSASTVEGKPTGIYVDDASANITHSAGGTGQGVAAGAGVHDRVDLSHDDEIDKATMVLFYPKRMIERSFASDLVARDAHLNLFETARGVAVLTLSYLDKTVAAGLATVQQQADMEYLTQLNKQVGLATAKLANPGRSRFYDDVQEKFSLCMGTGDESFDVKKQCKEAIVDGYPLCPKELYDNKAMFHFCMCCADQSLAVNYSTVDPRPHTFEGYSTVDRALLGKRLPVATDVRNTGTTTVSEIGKTMLEISRYFRLLYGDLIMYNSEVEVSRGIAENAKTKIKALPPLLDLSQFLTTIRNLDEFRNSGLLEATRARGLYYPSDVRWVEYARRIFSDPSDACITDVYPDFKFPYCPIPGVMKYGICPAFRELVRLHRTQNMSQWIIANKTRYDELYNEVALGSIVTGAMFQYIANESDAAERERMIDEKCDSLALEAFAKIHEGNIKTMNSLLDSNRSASEADKAEVRNLAYAVTMQFEGLLNAGINRSSYIDNATAANAARRASQAAGAQDAANQAMRENFERSRTGTLGGISPGAR